MPLDETAPGGVNATQRLIAAGLVLAACLAPAAAIAQAPNDPNAKEKQKQQHRQGPPPQPRGNPQQGAPKGPPQPQHRQPPQQQSGPSIGKRPDAGPPRGAPQGDFRRADPRSGPAQGPGPQVSPRRGPPPQVQGRPPQPPGPPPKVQVQDPPRRFVPGQPPLPPPGRPATASERNLPPPPDNVRRPRGGPGGPDGGQRSFKGGPNAPSVPKSAGGPGRRPLHIDQVRQERVRSVGPGGQTVIQEPGNRTIVKQGGRAFITRNESTVIQNFAPGARTSRRPDGVTETVFARRDGSRVFTEVDRNGRLMHRYRRDSCDREIEVVANRHFLRNVAIGVGTSALATAVIVSLPRPVLAIPREKYIVEYVNASDADVYECLTAPPIEHLERDYSLDEIRYSVSVRDRVRRIDLDNINFETGSFEITPDQYGKLERVARAIGRAIEGNPAEVFLIEGHTDAVGTEEDNLSLSDRRAESVAQILVEHFQIPLENLVTQGYGEQFPKVETQAPERLNRRVAVRRITPLLSQK